MMGLLGSSTTPPAAPTLDYDAFRWSYEFRWPKAHDKVFLLLATRMAGEALFGDEWTGSEPHAHFGNPVTLETFRSWDQLSDEERQTRRAAGRFYQVVTWLAENGRAANFKTYLLVGDAQFAMNAPLHEQPDLWNGSDDFRAFRYGRGLFAVVNGQPVFGDVFVDRIGLESALASVAVKTEALPPQEMAKLSPFMQIAIAVHQRSASGDTKGVLKALISEEWAKFCPEAPMTDRAVDHIAAVISPPDVEAMRKGALAQEKRKQIKKKG